MKTTVIAVILGVRAEAANRYFAGHAEIWDQIRSLHVAETEVERAIDERFVWLIGHDDLEQANAEYYASAERAALDPDPARHLAEVQTWLLDER